VNSPTTTLTTVRPESPTATGLHLLRVSGSRTHDDLADAIGPETVDALLADGLATVAGSRVLLTPEGRDAHQRAIAHELNENGCRAAIEDGYSRFLPLNAEVLQLCTDWQIRGGAGGAPIPNDHRDAAYDAEIVNRLSRVLDQVRPVLDELATELPRYAAYRDDLAHAVGRVMAGNTDFLTNPRVRCFHTVWFELHEDLLATLGLDRSDEDG
jgi:hypothetical protein